MTKRLSGIAKKRRRRLVWKKSDKTCFYCGVLMHFEGKKNDNKMTGEHLMPLSKGGTNARSNLVAACNKCNMQRGSRDLAEFAGVKISKPKPVVSCQCENPVIKRQGNGYVCSVCKQVYEFKRGCI